MKLPNSLFVTKLNTLIEPLIKERYHLKINGNSPEIKNKLTNINELLIDIINYKKNHLKKSRKFSGKVSIPKFLKPFWSSVKALDIFIPTLPNNRYSKQVILVEASNLDLFYFSNQIGDYKILKNYLFSLPKLKNLYIPKISTFTKYKYFLKIMNKYHLITANLSAKPI